MQTTPTKSKRKIFIALTAITTLAVVVVVSVQLTANKDANVELFAVPGDARFEVAGKTYKPGKAALPIGSQEITAKREGFADRTQRVTITNKLQPVTFALTAESAEAKQWVKNNADKFTELESIAGEAAQLSGEEFRSSNPIITILPYRGVLFSIDYKVSRQTPDDITLIISANSSANRSFALQYITKAGYDLSEYRVEFKDYNNPLEKAGS